ncbi:MAG TPA: RNase adapter RapZ [Bacteroidales bacterium]|nr:RNase adapter RapZ [Bacteroidales bacterium]
MNKIQNLALKTFGESPVNVTPLVQSGSDRQYFRIRFRNKSSVIAAVNPHIRENRVFYKMTKYFGEKGLPVPELFAVSEDETTCLLQDLGDETLLDHVLKHRENDEIHPESLAYYRQALEELAAMQTSAGDYDYSYTWPVPEFDRQAVIWDLNYFKYYYAKLAGAPFDEKALQDDFEKLADFLMSAPSDYFMFRDFQSRNIMIHNKQVWFIDYQGGRKGALQYDVASLLYQARAKLPESVRDELLKHYLSVLSHHIDVDKNAFLNYYQGFVLIRVLQTLGAYGFRGLYEQKSHFILSLPMAIENLHTIRHQHDVLSRFPELASLVDALLDEKYQPFAGENTEQKDKLQVTISSFSYKKGLPRDYSGHGGGHVFDCRAIHNPGRYEKYKTLTGKDKPVIDFLDQTEEMTTFLEHVKAIVAASVETYQRRGFDHLSVSFGCTGGQHRSVYAAEKLAASLKNKYSVNLVIRHREQNM